MATGLLPKIMADTSFDFFLLGGAGGRESNGFRVLTFSTVLFLWDRRRMNRISSTELFMWIGGV